MTQVHERTDSGQQSRRTSEDAVMEHTALAILSEVVSVGAKDSVVVLHDPSVPQSVVDALARSSLRLGHHVTVVSVPAVLAMTEEPPNDIATILCVADVVLLASQWHAPWMASRAVWRAIYEYSTILLHFDPPHALALSGKSCVGVLPAIEAAGARLLKALHGARHVQVSDRFGNVLTFGIHAGSYHFSSKFPLDVGFTQVPPGTFTVQIVPGSFEGRIAWDALEGYPSRRSAPVLADVEGGVVTRVSGDSAAARALDQSLRETPTFGMIGEFGIGLNPMIDVEAVLDSDWHESADRAQGVVHFGLGASMWRGRSGRMPFHTHAVTLYADVKFDDSDVVTAGVIRNE